MKVMRNPEEVADDLAVAWADNPNELLAEAEALIRRQATVIADAVRAEVVLARQRDDLLDACEAQDSVTAVAAAEKVRAEMLTR